MPGAVAPSAPPSARHCTRRKKIVIVKSRFLERPQKRSRRNQFIHRLLTKTKSIGSGQDPESQAGRQLDGYGGWCLELRRGGRYGDDDEKTLCMIIMAFKRLRPVVSKAPKSTGRKILTRIVNSFIRPFL